MERTESDGVVCACLQVTERQLHAAVRQSGAQTVRELIRTTGAGTGCTACHRRLESCLTRCEENPEAAQSEGEEMATATGRRWCLVLALSLALSSNCSLSRGTTQLVEVRSTPPGAEVTLNGEPVGETPLFVEVRRRDAEPVLRFEEAGFESVERELDRRRSGWFWGDLAVAVFFGGVAFFGASISSGVGAGTAGLGALWATAFLAPPVALGTAYGFPDRVRVVLPPLDEAGEPAEASVGGTAGRPVVAGRFEPRRPSPARSGRAPRPPTRTP